MYSCGSRWQRKVGRAYAVHPGPWCSTNCARGHQEASYLDASQEKGSGDADSVFESVRTSESPGRSDKGCGTKHTYFIHRVNQVRYDRARNAPTAEYVSQMQSLIEEELRMVEATELVQMNRNTDIVVADEVRVNKAAVATQRSPDVEATKGISPVVNIGSPNKDQQQQSQPSQRQQQHNRLCRNFKRDGRVFLWWQVRVSARPGV